MRHMGLGCSCFSRRNFLKTALASCAATQVSGWSTFARAAENVRIGFPTSDHYAPVFVARERKYFERAGLNVEYRSFPTGGPVIEGLTSKSLDIGFTGTPGMLSAARGFALTSVMGVALEGSGLLARTDGIQKMSDLAGKRVGMPARGSIAHLLLLRALTRANVDPGSVRIVEIREVEGLRVGLQRGEIDAAAIWEPWVYQLEQTAGIRKLALSSEIWPSHQCDLMWVNNTFLRERPDVVRAVMDGLLQGIRYVTQDFNDAANTVSKSLGIQPTVGANSMQRQQFTHVLQRENIGDQYRLLTNLNILKESEIPAWERLVDQGMYAYANKRWETVAKARV